MIYAVLFQDDDDLWATAIRAIGRSVIASAPGVRYIPENPNAN